MRYFINTSPDGKKFHWLDPRLAEHLQDGGVCILEEGREAGFGYPGGFGDVFLTLRGEVGGIRIQHVVPPGMLEVPDVVPEVAVVGDADETAELELVHAGFLLDLAQGGHFDILSGLLMAFGQVPESVPGNQQEIPAAVGHQSARGVDLLEFRTQATVGPFRIVGRDVDPGKGVHINIAS